MLSYPLLIDGIEESGKGWTYVIDASDQIDDLEGAHTMKRQLELGNLDPFDCHAKKIVGRCAWAGLEECRRAVSAARAASPAFGRYSVQERLQFIAKVHRELERRAAELIDVLVGEGHPRKLARWELSGMLAATADETLSWLTTQLEREFEWQGRRLRLVRKPDGVVCVNPPQNAAASNSFMGVLALLAGNTIVVRAPQSAPLGVMYLYHEIVRPLLEEWGAPRGTVNVVSAEGRATIKTWIADPRVDSILFFGDSKTGLKVGRDGTERGKKVVLELSGNDGLVVWRGADLDGAASALLESFYGSSQICMVPKFAVVHPEVADRFLDCFVSQAKQLAPGYPSDPDTVLTPVFKVGLFAEMLAEAEREGAKVLCGGRRVDVGGQRSHKGLFVEPTVVRVDGYAMAERLSCVREETFFPLLPIVVPDHETDEIMLEQMLAFVNSNEYGLRNSIWAKDDEVIERFANDVRNAGLLKVNDSHISFVPYLATHGGAGRTGGPFGELHYPALRLSRLQGIAVRQ